MQVWDYLTEKQYDKDVFLLNFGGGMVCDLGGFVASTYKRGIRYANCPTTLLAMIDAAIGGKTGVNLPSMKNGVGTIYFPDIQLPVDLSFLNTLHINDFLSGLGELIKYALIGSADLFHSLRKRPKFPSLTLEDVDFCIDFKMKIVYDDPYDKGIRHILNFGHTFGHALESYAAKTGNPIAHGIAVAQGLYYESLLSAKLGHLPQEDWQLIADFLTKHFKIPEITPEFLEKLLPYMQNDKKNHDGTLNFTLIDRIGHAIPNCQISTLTIDR
jgi:3-dehydroquinate synthase